MAVNITSIKTTSNGLWQGDNPLDFAFPLLIVQAVLVLAVSRTLSFVLKPLRQPNVIAEIIGGILLGPSALGRSDGYRGRLFPQWSLPILETVADIGLLFFLFLVGLELDLRSIRRSGTRALSIAAAGIALPFSCGAAIALLLRSSVPGADSAPFTPFLVFMGVALSITAFPVLARILAELNLLASPLGETAMAAAAFNDLAAWVLLALAVALSGGARHASPWTSLWVLLCAAAFVAFQMAFVRPAMAYVVKRAERDPGELWVCVTLAGVLVSGAATDSIGIHAIFGAFVFGLAIPKDGEFAARLTERIEDFVTGLLLPLYFASSGLKTDVTKIQGAAAWGLVALVVATACFGKIFGTFAAGMLCRMKAREAVTLGVLMNTKGLVELIVLNIGKERKVLNDETFAILVVTALVTTFMTTPIVMAIYKPARGSGNSFRKLEGSSTAVAAGPKEHRILACVHGPHDVPSIINLIETIRSGGDGGTKSMLKVYVMHLVELTERSSSIVLFRRFRRNGLPIRNPLVRSGGIDPSTIAVAFEAYRQLSRVTVRTMTAVSAMSTVHEDVCSVAQKKQVSLLVVPFHKHRPSRGCDTDAMEDVGPGWRSVNQRILKEAPCSVAVLVNRGFGGSERAEREVCVMFFGGPDDREALRVAARMAEHPNVRVTALRFVATPKTGENETPTITLRPSPMKCTEKNYTFSTAVMDRDKETELDEEAAVEFRRATKEWAMYEERSVDGVLEAVLAIGKSGRYDIIVVGRGRFPSPMVAEMAGRLAEHPELGPVGDALASSHNGVVSSVLVVQRHDPVHSEETPVSMVYDGDFEFIEIGG